VISDIISRGRWQVVTSQVTRDNMINDSTSSERMTSDTGKQYKQDFKLFTTINRRINRVAKQVSEQENI